MSVFEIVLEEELTPEQAEELLAAFEEEIGKRSYSLNYANCLDEVGLDDDEEEEEEDGRIVCCPACGYVDDMCKMFDYMVDKFHCPGCRITW